MILEENNDKTIRLLEHNNKITAVSFVYYHFFT